MSEWLHSTATPMPRQPRQPASSKLTGISLGPGTLTVSVDDLFQQYAPFGMTKRTYENFLKATGVPMLHTPCGIKLVDLYNVQLAHRAIHRMGAPDFYMPGHPAAAKAKLPKNSRTKVPLAEYTDHWKQFLAELLLSRRLAYKATTLEVQSAAERAINRIAVALASLTTIEIEKARLHARTFGDARQLDNPQPIGDAPHS